jgi:DNA polymerase-3 subunit alpha
MYSFNRSHAVAYSLVAYQCAWLKYYYPVQWATALLNERRDEQTKLKETIQEIRRSGIAFLHADIYASTDKYTAEDGGIRVGLTGLADFGNVAYNELQRITASEHIYTSLLDLVLQAKMSKLNSKAIGALIKAGALESLGDRKQLERELPLAVAIKQQEAHDRFMANQSAHGLTAAGKPLKRARIQALMVAGV